MVHVQLHMDYQLSRVTRASVQCESGWYSESNFLDQNQSSTGILLFYYIELMIMR